MKIVITSGRFDHIDKRHIEYLQKAKQLGDFLVCIVNNDNFLIEKNDKPFMDVFEETLTRLHTELIETYM